jgi:TIR domain
VKFMTRVFISHSSADKYFVDLLVEVLQYHHIDVWYDTAGIEVGDKYKDEIDKGLASSDYLIVVASKSSCGSKWVTREIATFNVTKGDSFIIPIVLEPINLNEVFDGLKDVQGVLFYKNMLAAFQSLLGVFGQKFLARVDRRSDAERRGLDRRDDKDRRQSSVIQRFRIGLWKCYEDKAGVGKFDQYDLSLSSRLKALDILQNELDKYNYYDKDGIKHELSIGELDRITYEVWEEMGTRSYVTTIIVIEAVAEKIYNSYTVEPINRRTEDRRSNTDRRDERA